MYDLHLTAEQIEMRDTVRDFVEKEIKPVVLHPSRLEPFEKPLLTDLLGAGRKWACARWRCPRMPAVPAPTA